MRTRPTEAGKPCYDTFVTQPCANPSQSASVSSSTSKPTDSGASACISDLSVVRHKFVNGPTWEAKTREDFRFLFGEFGDSIHALGLRHAPIELIVEKVDPETNTIWFRSA